MYLYNLLNKSTYTFNFEKWFSNFNIQYDEIKMWKHILLKASKNISLRNCTGYYFQYPLNLGQENVLLHFNVDRIQNLSHQDIYDIKLSEISTDYKNFSYIYSPTSKYSSEHITTAAPIIFCPLPTYYGIRNVVIDGNHRVTAKKARQISQITAITYIPNSQNDFLNEFEYKLYSFLKFLYF